MSTDCPTNGTMVSHQPAYENDNGHFQDEEIPAAIRRLVDPTGNEGHRLRTFDSSRFGLWNSDFRDGKDIDQVDLNRNELQLPGFGSVG